MGSVTWSGSADFVHAYESLLPRRPHRRKADACGRQRVVRGDDLAASEAPALMPNDMRGLATVRRDDELHFPRRVRSRPAAVDGARAAVGRRRRSPPVVLKQPAGEFSPNKTVYSNSS